MMRLALDQLVALFGPEMAHPLDMSLQDWATVPTIARAQDQQNPTAHPTYGLPKALAELVQNGLHFASTETAAGFGGFLEGALEAAERTVNDLTLTIPDAT
jgi:monoamine oxidase